MLPTPTPQLVVQNHSRHVIDQQAWNMAWCLGYQVRWQAGPLLKIAADVSFLASGLAIPTGAWVIDLIDNEVGAENAAGYHDEDGNEVPYGRVLVEPSLDGKLPISEVLSHEGIELLCDPHVNLTSFDPRSGRLYPVEMCDPVQGGSYDLGAPYGRKTGVIMSDFVLTGWFDPNTPSGQSTSYRNTVKGPFSLAHGGYVSYTTTLPPQWEQQMAEGLNPLWLDRDDRVIRRTAAASA